MGRMVDAGYDVTSITRFENRNALAFLISVFAIFFGYANFVVMGYFKDISADRKTGYRTFPVVFGWRRSALLSDLIAVAVAVLTCSVLVLTGEVTVWALGIFAVAVAINLRAQIGIHRIRDERKTHGPIKNVVRAFILYCLAIVVTLKPGWAIFLLVFYFMFELTLKLRPEKTQV